MLLDIAYLFIFLMNKNVLIYVLNIILLFEFIHWHKRHIKNKHLRRFRKIHFYYFVFEFVVKFVVDSHDFIILNQHRFIWDVNSIKCENYFFYKASFIIRQ
jgi:hypothetical protein